MTMDRFKSFYLKVLIVYFVLPLILCVVAISPSIKNDGFVYPKEREASFVVKILVRQSSNAFSGASGSIVHPEWVLSAADNVKSKPKPSEIRISYGVFIRDLQPLTCTEVHIHPEYSKDTSYNVALLKVLVITFSTIHPMISKVELWPPKKQFTKMKCSFYGWGPHTRFKVAFNLRRVDIMVGQSENMCQCEHRRTLFVCGYPGLRPCICSSIDNGGPLICNGTQVGLAYGVYSCVNGSSCSGPDIYNKWVFIPAVDKFIQRQIYGNSGQKSCMFSWLFLLVLSFLIHNM